MRIGGGKNEYGFTFAFVKICIKKVEQYGSRPVILNSFSDEEQGFVRVVFALVYDEHVVPPGDTENQLFKIVSNLLTILKMGRIITNMGRILLVIRFFHSLWKNFIYL